MIDTTLVRVVLYGLTTLVAFALAWDMVLVWRESKSKLTRALIFVFYSMVLMTLTQAIVAYSVAYINPKLREILMLPAVLQFLASAYLFYVIQFKGNED
jgi:hypothetical protein